MTVLLGGVPTLICGLLMIPFVENDNKIIGYGQEDTPDALDSPGKIGTWSEMFTGKYAMFTIICLTIAGLNFFGYQAFTGFMTLYLKDLDGFSPDNIGMQVTLQGIGALIGGLAWGYVADRFGRKINLVGFFFTAITTALYITISADPYILGLIVFCYGFMVSCTYSWGVYFTELFPVHLRPMGASLFHGGLVFSLFAPSIVAFVAESHGLVTGMMLAPMAFFIAALLWMLLPETLTSSSNYKGFDPNSVAE
jgi:MFS family permease